MLKNKKSHKEKTSTSKSKKILTIYSSNKSINPLIPKSCSIALKKINNKSNLNSKHKDQHKRSKQRSIAKHKLIPSENYEKIPVHFVNSNTNSEIEFSHYEENIKNYSKPYRKLLYIDCDDKALIN
jgi:hypothetical protein